MFLHVRAVAETYQVDSSHREVHTSKMQSTGPRAGSFCWRVHKRKSMFLHVRTVAKTYQVDSSHKDVHISKKQCLFRELAYAHPFSSGIKKGQGKVCAGPIWVRSNVFFKTKEHQCRHQICLATPSTYRIICAEALIYDSPARSSQILC